METSLIANLNRYSYQIRILRSVLSFDLPLAFYYAQIESRLLHGICFWGFATVLNDVFIVQKRIVRTMVGASCRDYFHEHKILTVYGLNIQNTLELIHSNKSEFQVNGDTHVQLC